MTISRILTGILFFLSVCGYSDNIDSLAALLKTPLSDVERCKIYNDISEAIISNDPDSAFHCASMALQIAQQTGQQEEESAALNNIGICYYFRGSYPMALEYYMKSMELREALGSRNALATTYNNMGALYSETGNFGKSLEYFFLALEMAKEANDPGLLSRTYNNIGLIYYYTGQYDKSLECYQKSLDIKIAENDRIGIANSYNNIGEVHRIRTEYSKALEFFLESLQIFVELEDIRGQSRSYSNIGLSFKYLKNYPEAERYYRKSLEIKEQQGNRYGIAITLFNLGDLYYKTGRIKISEETLNQAIAMASEINAKDILKDSYEVLSLLFENKGNIPQALHYHKLYSSLKDSILNNETSDKIADYQTQYETLEKEKEIMILNKDRMLQDLELIKNKTEIKKKNVLITTFIVLLVTIVVFSLLLYKLFRDKKKVNKELELRNMEITQQNEEIFQQKEEIQSINDTLEQVNLELEKQSIVARQSDNAVMILSPNGDFEWINDCMLRKYGYSLEHLKQNYSGTLRKFSSYPHIDIILDKCITEKTAQSYESKTITKTGELIWTQTTLSPIIDNEGIVTKVIAIDSDITVIKNAEMEVLQTSKLLERKNRQITDSISYAKKIQESILPPGKVLKENYPESFIFYKPRDIVSGDFYWYTTIGNRIYTAVVDCTGHGVPGAFMSIIGSNLLDDIVNDKKYLDPGKILSLLSARTISALSSEGGDNHQDDGMDISLCCFDRQKKTLEVATANHVVYFVQDGIVRVITGNQISIGEKDKNDKIPEYDTFKVTLEKTTRIYMFSDGFQDQFGGPNNKKFMASRFKELIADLQQFSMIQQEAVLNSTFTEWKGEQRQIDDVLIWGIQMEV